MVVRYISLIAAADTTSGKMVLEDYQFVHNGIDDDAFSVWTRKWPPDEFPEICVDSL